MFLHTLGCAVVIVQDCGEAIEEGMIELADADVDAEDGGENEVKEKVEHCCYVAFMRQRVCWEGSQSIYTTFRSKQVCVKSNVGLLHHPKPELRLSYAWHYSCVSVHIVIRGALMWQLTGICYKSPVINPYHMESELVTCQHAHSVTESRLMILAKELPGCRKLLSLAADLNPYTALRQHLLPQPRTLLRGGESSHALGPHLFSCDAETSCAQS